MSQHPEFAIETQCELRRLAIATAELAERIFRPNQRIERLRDSDRLVEIAHQQDQAIQQPTEVQKINVHQQPKVVAA